MSKTQVSFVYEAPDLKVFLNCHHAKKLLAYSPENLNLVILQGANSVL
jgi:hypothetical protein